MKAFLSIFIILSLAVLGYSAAIDTDEDGWQVPQEDGTFVWMSKDEYNNYHSVISERRTLNIDFFLYTKSNSMNAQPLTIGNTNSLSSSNFNKALPTKFIIHGWLNSVNSPVNTVIRNAYLSMDSYNIIVVDWSRYSIQGYIGARNSVENVGKRVAEFIDFLHNNSGVSLSSITLIGHSLGAHVAGFAGKNVKSGQIYEIIGLDPALPLFLYNNCNKRLCLTDASFVSSMTTNGGLLGFLKPIGKLAFYPNGGKKQPGCGLDLDGACSHNRAIYYYGEAVTNNDFATINCNNYLDATNDKCGSTYSSVRMADASNYNLAGYYYVPVRKESLYGMAS